MKSPRITPLEQYKLDQQIRIERSKAFYTVLNLPTVLGKAIKSKVKERLFEPSVNATLNA